MRISPLKWTSKKVEDLIKQINQTSVIPKYSPFYDRQFDLRAPDLNFGYTTNELVEKTKSKMDIFYFARNFCHIMTEDGIALIKLRPYQKRVLSDLSHPDYRFNVFLASRQIGKCVSPYTMVETANHGKVPMFKLYYATKPNLSLVDAIIYALLSIRFSLFGKES